MDRPEPEFALGQRVRVVLNDRNRTPHEGAIRAAVWHHKHGRFYYFLQEAGRKVSKRYAAEDLQPVGHRKSPATIRQLWPLWSDLDRLLLRELMCLPWEAQNLEVHDLWERLTRPRTWPCWRTGRRARSRSTSSPRLARSGRSPSARRGQQGRPNHPLQQTGAAPDRSLSFGVRARRDTIATSRNEVPEVGMSEPRPLHRLFGLSWIDFFEGTPIAVETELDLSLKQQFIDLVLIRKGSQPISRPLPDGFEDLAGHNLITFKSHQEALDPWALWELVGHFVNYRKQVSPSKDDLLPEADFRLLAVCARFPNNLAQQVTLTPLRAGVYDVTGLGLRVRVIVVHQLPLQEHNAMLHLFSAREELLRYGKEHYRPHSPETSTLLYDLFKEYSEEPDMSDKLKEYARESLAKWPLKERLKGASAEELVQALSPETLHELIRLAKKTGHSAEPGAAADRPRE